MDEQKKQDETCRGKSPAWFVMLDKITKFTFGELALPAPIEIASSAGEPMPAAAPPAPLQMIGFMAPIAPVLIVPLGGRVAGFLMPVACDCDGCRRLKKIARRN